MHIMRLRRVIVVHITSDVEVPVIRFISDLFEVNATCVPRNVLKSVISGHDLLHVFWAQVILCTAGMKLGISIDEQNPTAAILGLVGITLLAGKIWTHH